MPSIPAAKLAWYAFGRFYDSDDGPYDAGYFAHLGPITPLFCGALGPGTAHLTFHAEPISAFDVPASGIQIGADKPGDFSIHYQATPKGTFDNGSSFCCGPRVARFHRPFVVFGEAVTLGAGQSLKLNEFSAILVESTPFEHAGRTWDIGELLPNGITQNGVALAGSTPTDANAADFAGSAIAIGPSGDR